MAVLLSRCDCKEDCRERGRENQQELDFIT